MYNFNSWKEKEGCVYPLGVSYLKKYEVFNFAIYSKHATEVKLLVYSEFDLINPIFSRILDYQQNKSNRIWHCAVPASEIATGKYYAYRISGPPPSSQTEWHAFDPEKVLLDPYARLVHFPPDFSRDAAIQPGPNDGKAPLGILSADEVYFDWQEDSFIIHESDLIIYEVHVKGFTYHESSTVSLKNRGTFMGIIEKIPYLQELGITALELMPVFQFEKSDGNYWGYNPLNIFTPHHMYASTSETKCRLAEFKTMVRELHKAGIEVILDVVYNHTAEGDHNGPTYCYKGIDNSTYYLINEDLEDPYFNYSGTGNTLHTKNSYVRRMIMDSLRYWRKEMHVDGFRFDLASIFSRNTDGSISFEETPIFDMIVSDPDLALARIIAEPWDATGTVQLGKKFPGIIWMQWNCAFRDDVRQFIKGDYNMTGSLASRLYGSDDLFPDNLENAYHAYQSVNYITCHDGFTLNDLVSYNQKHNMSNGHNNADGQNENFSWNCGKEGNENIPVEIMELRKKQVRNFCVLLFLANGTPMFVAGDEFLRTQKGNNNPYNQDNQISWVNWNLRESNDDVFQFFKKMITFRKSHPSLGRSRFWRSDVKWFGTQGQADFGYHTKTLAFFLDGTIENDDDLYVMINSYWEAISFTFQEAGPWYQVVDTARFTMDQITNDNPSLIDSENYLVKDRSVAVFIRLKK